MKNEQDETSNTKKLIQQRISLTIDGVGPEGGVIGVSGRRLLTMASVVFPVEEHDINLKKLLKKDLLSRS
jgi:hypothetical protein